jgi:hypothetical protein
MNPSPTCDDSTFIRRATLDATGVLPTAAEARAFVADSSCDKRAKLIDRLLARPEFAEHWALKWSDLLRNEEKVLDAKGVDVFYAWIRDSLAAGKPIDQFVRELVSARGSTYENPPANFYRANRDPATRGESPRGCSSACGCNAPAATRIPTTAGRMTTITVGPRSSGGSTIRFSATPVRTGSTSTSSTASSWF